MFHPTAYEEHLSRVMDPYHYFVGITNAEHTPDNCPGGCKCELSRHVRLVFVGHRFKKLEHAGWKEWFECVVAARKARAAKVAERNKAKCKAYKARKKAAGAAEEVVAESETADIAFNRAAADRAAAWEKRMRAAYEERQKAKAAAAAAVPADQVVAKNSRPPVWNPYYSPFDVSMSFSYGKLPTNPKAKARAMGRIFDEAKVAAAATTKLQDKAPAKEDMTAEQKKAAWANVGLNLLCPFCSPDTALICCHTAHGPGGHSH